VGDHLSGSFVTSGLERHSPPKWSTALHAGKDLFVAFPSCDGHIPRGNSRPFGVDVSVVTSILADDGRYPLPVCRFCPPEVATESSIPPKPWRRGIIVPLRIKLRGTLNFAAACGRQNWRMFGLSSRTSLYLRERSSSLVCPHYTTFEIKVCIKEGLNQRNIAVLLAAFSARKPYAL